MEWIVKVEQTIDKGTLDADKPPKEQIRIVFDPIGEEILFYGEAKVWKNDWVIFSKCKHSMKIQLEELQEEMAKVVKEMRLRLIEYKNLAEGFTVLKIVEFDDED